MKKFTQRTPAEIYENLKERCAKCPYRGVVSTLGIMCNYLGIVGHSRGCDPFECEHYKDKVDITKSISLGTGVKYEIELLEKQEDEDYGFPIGIDDLCEEARPDISDLN